MLHCAPEAYIGGPLALLKTGDLITVDVPARTIYLEVSDVELASRRAAWTPPAKRYERGDGFVFSKHILQADQGCDFDFLETSFACPSPSPISSEAHDNEPRDKTPPDGRRHGADWPPRRSR